MFLKSIIIESIIMTAIFVCRWIKAKHQAARHYYWLQIHLAIRRHSCGSGNPVLTPSGFQLSLE